MINSINLIRNTGLFDSVNSAANLPLGKLTLVYAENGRGKTTLSSILRSLCSGNPTHVNERRRLGSQAPPHIVLACTGDPATVQFHNNSWNRVFPEITIYDDVFIAENVCSGLVITSNHRQNLHELILGSQGVTLNIQLKQLIDNIEVHNSELRTHQSAIPIDVRGGRNVDEFCNLENEDDIESKIQAAERNLLAARQSELVTSTPIFALIQLPVFDIMPLELILLKDIDSLNSAAVSVVQEHFSKFTPNPENWISLGMNISPITAINPTEEVCPFCAQNLSGSSIFQHYRTYFSVAYKELKDEIASTLSSIESMLGEESQVGFERSIRAMAENRQFWSQFCEIPTLQVDSTLIIQDWLHMRDMIRAKLILKQANPLDPIVLTEIDKELVTTFDTHIAEITHLNQLINPINIEIQRIKQNTVGGNINTLVNDVNKLKATKARHSPAIATLCIAYLSEKDAKTETERLRDLKRSELEAYRTNVFPVFQEAVNSYLRILNAGYQLANVAPTNIRSGSACNFNILINNLPVPINQTEGNAGQPSFHNTLSSGDRNTLALAFFFATLDSDPNLIDKIVVIDDPVSTLDDHRTLATVQEIRRLSLRTNQVIVLSHNKRFLCSIWDGADRIDRSSLQIVRDINGSSIISWNVDHDSITEHDRLFSTLNNYRNGNPSNLREVAIAIRPYLEGFLRVSCPHYFVPGTLIGPFINLCRQRVGTQEEIMNDQSINDLDDIKEYANRFHHDTNANWETADVNDGELNGFVVRTMNFASL